MLAVRLLMIAAATIIPLGVMLVSDGLPFIFGAVIFFYREVGSSALCTSRYLCVANC